MNLESTPVKKNTPPMDELSFDEFDFKPLTSGLGFHQPKTTEIKPAFVERTVAMPQPAFNARKENTVYQNDLSLFYGSQQTVTVPAEEKKEEKYFRLAERPQRVFAYLLDLGFVLSCLGMVLTLMSHLVGMDLIDLWNNYPDEFTPLVLTLFCGFYLIYFSVFEKANQSTLGKNLFHLRVVSDKDQIQTFPLLLLRSFITLANFIGLGLFSYFDLQDKMTYSKVVRVD